METPGTFEEILDFAIEREEAAAAFYTDLATRAAQPSMKTVFKRLAAEETGHRNMLQGIKKDPARLPTRGKVVNLQVADYLVASEPTPETPYQDLLVIAIKREMAAARMYKDLAAVADDAGLQKLLLRLSDEEANHQLRFEQEYDDYVLLEN